MTWAAGLLLTVALLGSPAGSSPSSGTPAPVLLTVVSAANGVGATSTGARTTTRVPAVGPLSQAVIEPDQYADLILAGYALALIGCVQVLLLAVIAVRLLTR